MVTGDIGFSGGILDDGLLFTKRGSFLDAFEGGEIAGKGLSGVIYESKIA